MKIAHGTLVLAIDGGKMLLFRNEGDEKYAVLDTLSHREIDNPPTREQGADAPGRSYSSVGSRRSAYGQTDGHDRAEEDFAIRAAEGLERVAASDGAGIVVLAPPRMLGQLRKDKYQTHDLRILQGKVWRVEVGNTEQDTNGKLENTEIEGYSVVRRVLARA